MGKPSPIKDTQQAEVFPTVRILEAASSKCGNRHGWGKDEYRKEDNVEKH
jgi:hypothetical protein